jgi:hypothetical protein
LLFKDDTIGSGRDGGEVLLRIGKSSQNQNARGGEAIDEIGQEVESLFAAEIEVQKDDVRAAEICIRERLGRRLSFPQYGHPRTVFDQHAQAGANDCMIIDYADFDRYRIGRSRVTLLLREKSLISSLGHFETLYIH